MRQLWLILALAGAACELDERPDFLLGRECDPQFTDTCEAGEVCLPHTWLSDGPRDFYCRNELSIVGDGSAEPPLAYCDTEQYLCPGTTVCRADRVRPLPEGGIRREVCQSPTSPFGPPS